MVDRFLELAAGLSLSEAAALWSVSPTYVSKLRDGARPERMHAGTRKALIAAIERLEAQQLEAEQGRAVRESPATYGEGYGAGYAAAILESISADARHIMEKADAARARIIGVAELASEATASATALGYLRQRTEHVMDEAERGGPPPGETRRGITGVVGASDPDAVRPAAAGPKPAARKRGSGGR